MRVGGYKELRRTMFSRVEIWMAFFGTLHDCSLLYYVISPFIFIDQSLRRLTWWMGDLSAVFPVTFREQFFEAWSVQSYFSWAHAPLIPSGCPFSLRRMRVHQTANTFSENQVKPFFLPLFSSWKIDWGIWVTNKTKYWKACVVRYGYR
jgi:hypothetical protein